jgi:hypothetical protein
LIAACLVGAGQAETPSSEAHGRAYLFRGLIGLIDWGMDELAQRINRSGVAANIGPHLAWREVANQAINDYRRNPKPISVIGHSIGGDAALEFAQALNAAHVLVILLITYDPNRSAGRVPANVARYINSTNPPISWAAVTSRRAQASMATTLASTSKIAPKSSTSMWTSSRASRSN